MTRPAPTPAELAASDQAHAAFNAMGVTLAPDVDLALLFAVDGHGSSNLVAHPDLPATEVIEYLRHVADSIESQL